MIYTYKVLASHLAYNRPNPYNVVHVPIRLDAVEYITKSTRCYITQYAGALSLSSFITQAIRRSAIIRPCLSGFADLRLRNSY